MNCYLCTYLNQLRTYKDALSPMLEAPIHPASPRLVNDAFALPGSTLLPLLLTYD
jgi:hypothetical protein